MNRGDCGEYRQAAEAVAQMAPCVRGVILALTYTGMTIVTVIVHTDQAAASGGIEGARGRAKLLSGPVARVCPTATHDLPKNEL
jgi:hypothetical protein